jgi:hypothetical protein
MQILTKLALAFDRSLQKHFFGAAPAQSLSLFRFLYCLSIAWYVANGLGGRLRFFEGTTWYPIPLFELCHVPLMSAAAFHALHYVLLAALFLTAFGAFTRFSATVAWIAFFFYMGTYLGFTKSPHTNYVVHSTNIVVFVLLILSLAPKIGCYGFDGWRSRGWRWSCRGQLGQAAALVSAWPTQLIKLALGIAYFGAGYCKIVTNIFWADGETLQAHLMSKHLLLDCELGASIAQNYWLCLALGIGTLVLELTFVSVVYFPRLKWLYVLGSLSFHTAIYLTMKINFFPFFCCTLLIFLDWTTLTALAASLRKTLDWLSRSLLGRQVSVEGSLPAAAMPATYGDTRGARLVVLGIATLLWVCVFGRIESWPLTDYRVFQGRHKLSSVRVYRLAGVDAHGEWEWIGRFAVPILPEYINGRVTTYVKRSEEQSLRRFLHELAEHVKSGHSQNRFQEIVLIERTLQYDPVSGQPRVFDRPYEQIRLRGAPGEGPIVIASREGPALTY